MPARASWNRAGMACGGEGPLPHTLDDGSAAACCGGSSPRACPGWAAGWGTPRLKQVPMAGRARRAKQTRLTCGFSSGAGTPLEAASPGPCVCPAAGPPGWLPWRLASAPGARGACKSFTPPTTGAPWTWRASSSRWTADGYIGIGKGARSVRLTAKRVAALLAAGRHQNERPSSGAINCFLSLSAFLVLLRGAQVGFGAETVYNPGPRSLPALQLQLKPGCVALAPHAPLPALDCHVCEQH